MRNAINFAEMLIEGAEREWWAERRVGGEKNVGGERERWAENEGGRRRRRVSGE